jgi:hypothetical protein
VRIVEPLFSVFDPIAQNIHNMITGMQHGRKNKAFSCNYGYEMGILKFGRASWYSGDTQKNLHAGGT